MSEIEVRGAEGDVRLVYTTAVVVGPWTFVGDRQGGTLTADVVSVDAYKVTRQPLSFVARKQGAPWTWPILELQIDGTKLFAKLGPFKESAHAMPVRSA